MVRGGHVFRVAWLSDQTRGQGEVVGDQVPLRARRGALVGRWPVRRAAVVIRNPFPHVAIHSSHVRLKAQTNQILRERQHFCLIPGAVLLSSGPQIGAGQCA